MSRKKTTKKKTTKKKVTKKKTTKKTNTVKNLTLEEKVKMISDFVNNKSIEFEKVCQDAAAYLGLEVEVTTYLAVKGFSIKKRDNESLSK